jgi:hypothetical protein
MEPKRKSPGRFVADEAFSCRGEIISHDRVSEARIVRPFLGDSLSSIIQHDSSTPTRVFLRPTLLVGSYLAIAQQGFHFSDHVYEVALQVGACRKFQATRTQFGNRSTF